MDTSQGSCKGKHGMLLPWGAAGTLCFTLHSSSAFWGTSGTSVGIPLTTSLGHGLNQGMQRLTEIQGEPAAGHVSVGAAEC